MSSTSEPPERAGDTVHFGFKWLSLSFGLSRIVRLVTTVVLARMLDQSAFGLVTMATAAIYALSAFREIGISQAMIQRKSRDPDDERAAADTTFTLILATNLLLFVVGWLATPHLSSYFDRMEGLEPVFQAMLCLFLVEGFQATPTAVLHRRLEFGVFAVSEIVAAVLYAVLAILLAVLGFGVWGLVVGQLASRVIQAVVLTKASGWQPGLRVRWSMARELFDYGKWLWGSAALQVISRSADKIVLGKVAGSVVLGSYGVAYNLCTAFALPVTNVVNKLAFPALSRMQEDLAAVSRAYVRAIALISFAAVPAAAGLAVVAGDFVTTVYGSRWSDMVPIVQVLSFYGAALAVGTVAGPVLLALGRPKAMMLVGAGRQLALLALLALLARRGSVAIAWAVLLPALASMTVGHVVAARASRSPITGVFDPLLRTGAATAAMVLAVAWLQGSTAAAGWEAPVRLSASIAVGVVVYLAATLVLNRGVLVDGLQNAKRVLLAKGRLA